VIDPLPDLPFSVSTPHRTPDSEPHLNR
jgi:hypothetical protein